VKAKSLLVDEAPRTEIPERGVSIGLVNAALGAKNVAMHINVLYPNTSGPYHFHARSENVYYVLMGFGTVLIEGEEHPVGPEQVLFIPPGVKHSVTNKGPGLLKLIEIYAPPASSDFHIVE
jgi:mannose-6-phosphate isomerase-like protein (cupin superfamily)